MLCGNPTIFASSVKVICGKINDPLLQDQLSKRKSEGRFIPTRALCSVSSWDRATGTVWVELRKVLCRALVTLTKLLIITEFEAAVNDISLGYVSGDLKQRPHLGKRVRAVLPSAGFDDQDTLWHRSFSEIQPAGISG